MKQRYTFTIEETENNIPVKVVEEIARLVVTEISCGNTVTVVCEEEDFFSISINDSDWISVATKTQKFPWKPTIRTYSVVKDPNHICENWYSQAVRFYRNEKE